jgi:hypothetical protein
VSCGSESDPGALESLADNWPRRSSDKSQKKRCTSEQEHKQAQPVWQKEGAAKRPARGLYLNDLSPSSARRVLSSEDSQAASITTR